MDKLLKQWLETTPALGDDAVRTTVSATIASWTSVPPPALIEVAGTVEPFIEPMSEEWRTQYTAELEGMEKAWSKMRQDVADKHVTVYKRKKQTEGYVFCGAQNADRMTIKWIVCGTPKFTENYKNVVTKDDETSFNKAYKRSSGQTPYTTIDAFDAEHAEHRYQRVCKFSAPKHDSGWIKI